MTKNELDILCTTPFRLMVGDMELAQGCIRELDMCTPDRSTESYVTLGLMFFKPHIRLNRSNLLIGGGRGCVAPPYSTPDSTARIVISGTMFQKIMDAAQPKPTPVEDIEISGKCKHNVLLRPGHMCDLCDWEETGQ